MTRDQKTVLKAFAALVGFKAALYASIVYSSRVARQLRSTVA